jgi:hypothetical protein
MLLQTILTNFLIEKGYNAYEDAFIVVDEDNKAIDDDQCMITTASNRIQYSFNKEIMRTSEIIVNVRHFDFLLCQNNTQSIQAELLNIQAINQFITLQSIDLTVLSIKVENLKFSKKEDQVYYYELTLQFITKVC